MAGIDLSEEDKIKAQQYAERKTIRAIKGPLSPNKVMDDATRGLYERNWQEQCYLVESAHSLAVHREPSQQAAATAGAGTKWGAPQQPHDGKLKAFFPGEAQNYYRLVAPGPFASGDSLEFDSDIVNNMFSKASSASALYTATPHVLSALVPHVKIWKVFYNPTATMKNQSEDTKALLNKIKEQVSVPMDFNVHTTRESISDILKGTSGKTDDVGLKSFTYQFHGGDLVTKEILKCEMTLHFNSVEGLVKQRTSYVEGHPVKWAWLDIIGTRVLGNKNQKFLNSNPERKHEPFNYEIKVEIGWSGEPTSINTLAPDDKEAQQAFGSMISPSHKKQLFLTLMSHTIKFNQDGSLDINISFAGRATSRWRSKSWELLWLSDETAGGLQSEKDLYELEDDIKNQIKDIKKTLSMEAEEKSNSLASDQKKPGVIDLNVNPDSEYLIKAGLLEGSDSGKSLDTTEQKYGSALLASKDPAFNVYQSEGSPLTDDPNLGGVGAYVPDKFKGVTNPADIRELMSGADISVSQRELHALQYRLQRIRATRRGLGYNRLFKAMDPILYRLRIARSELGELADGQLARHEANKIRQPHYVEHTFEGMSLSAEQIEDQNKLYEARSLARAFGPGGGNLDQAAAEAKQFGFGSAISTSLDANGNIATLADKSSGQHLTSLQTAQANAGAMLISPEEAKRKQEVLSNKLLLEEAAGRPGAPDPDDAKKLAKEPEDIMILEYFFLGDLIDSLLEHIYENPEFRDKLSKKDNRMLVFAPFKYEHPLLAGIGDKATVQMVNLADIPISMRYFNNWFRRNFVLKFQDSIPFDSFFKLLMENLVFAALGEQCYAAGFNQISNLGVKSIITKKPLSELTKAYADAVDGPTARKDLINPAWSSTVFNGNFEEEFLNVSATDDWYEYYLVFANSYVPQFLTGEFKRDIFKGVHHVFIGANKGLVKNVVFQKIEQQQIQAYKIAASGARDVREIYKMKMTMIGNNFFEPGQLVYINPTLAGLGVKNYDSITDITRGLGLGGYYRINKVDGIIDSGRFETIVDGYWETFGAVRTPVEQDMSVISSGFGSPVGFGETINSGKLSGAGGLIDVNKATDGSPVDKAGS